MKQVYNGSAMILAPLQTQATGTNWSTFEDFRCNAVDIINTSGTTISVRRNAGGNAMPIADGTSRLMVGVTNANQLSVQRFDQSGTQVYVYAEALGSA